MHMPAKPLIRIRALSKSLRTLECYYTYTYIFKVMTINRFIKIKDMKTKNLKSLDRWDGYNGEISPGADKFCQWFVGFSDGESNFSIVPGYSGDKITKFSGRVRAPRFTRGLHTKANIQNDKIISLKSGMNRGRDPAV